MEAGEEKKAWAIIEECFEESLYSIGHEEHLKVSLIKEEDKVSVKFEGEYLVQNVSINRGYIVLYNYCEKLKCISLFYNEMQRKINCNISFEARPVFLHDDVRIKAHFLICFLSLVIYRYLERGLEHAFTCETILDKLKTINFADIQEQGFIPLYTCDKLTDALHEICEFDTDFKFITKSHMKTIQKKSKGRK